MSGYPTVDVTVYPHECDGSGYLHPAACVALLERARWDALACGPGTDLFSRAGVIPTARQTSVSHRSPVFPGDLLRVVTRVIDRGTTTFTVRQRVTRAADEVVVIEAELAFECVDRLGRPVPLPEEVARALDAPGGPREVRWLRVRDTELAVEVRGRGPALLLIHGFPLDRTQWRHQLLGFSQWRRIAPDLRGFGASANAPVGQDAWSMAGYVEDLVGVLDGLGAESAVVCGFSMGGYIALELWRRYPDRVRALVLMDTKAEGDTPEARRARDDMAAVAQRDGPEAIAERMVPRLLSRETLDTQPETVAHVRAMIGRATPGGMVAALHAMRDRRDNVDLLAGITVATLVVGGAEDALTPAEGMRAMAAAIPEATFVAVPSAGHLAPLEQPLAVNRAVREFLERVLDRR